MRERRSFPRRYRPRVAPWWGSDEDVDVFADIDDDLPTTSRMRRRRAEHEPFPGTRGRLTEEQRARLAREREAAATADLPPAGFRWSTWGDGSRGPEPYPAWLVTELAAVDTDLGVLKTGKEADVHLLERGVPGSDRRCLLASKRYRGSDHRLFHRDASYLEGRRLRRVRDQRAIDRRTSFGRNLIAQQWSTAEFDALCHLWTAGIPVPYPVQCLGTEVLMEFIGAEDGRPAPRLAQLRPDRGQLLEWWEMVRGAMVAMGRLGFTHGDLSAYNVLVDGDDLVFIDVPQLVDLAVNPQGRPFLERDARRICEWFTARGLSVDVADPDALVDLVLSEAGLA